MKTTFDKADRIGKCLARVVCAALDESPEFSLKQLFPLITPTLDILQSLLHLQFRGPLTLIEALSHPSFVNEFNASQLKSYQRLEFLGDAVLDLLVSEVINERYEELNEGELSKLRGSLVNESSLAKLAQSFHLSDYALVGRGELKNNGHERPSILADIVESLLGAAHVDQGLFGAKVVFNAMISQYKKAYGEEFFDLERYKNFDTKSKLQEECMRIFKELPSYSYTEIEGAFWVEVSVCGESLAKALGRSKKEGEKLVSRNILENQLLDKINKRGPHAN